MNMTLQIQTAYLGLAERERGQIKESERYKEWRSRKERGRTEDLKWRNLRPKNENWSCDEEDIL